MKRILRCFWAIFVSASFINICQGLAVSTEDSDDEGIDTGSVNMNEILSESDRNQIDELREQVYDLQQAMTEITRSFSTLDLVAKNPMMMSKLSKFGYSDVEKAIDTTEDKIEKSRLRRDVDSPSTFPTSFPTPPGGQRSNWGQNLAGPYSWPLFSGQCFLCPAGVPGPRGPPGPQGVAGRDGRDGRDAQIGPQPDVNARPEIPSSSLGRGDTPSQSSQPTVEQGGTSPQRLIYVNGTSGGIIYTRWGNSECPELAELIYSGTAGGAHYTHTGSGSNYLCLPAEPIYDEFETSASTDRALLYSSEYQTSSTGHSRLVSKHDHTPSCAVCRAPPGQTSKLMIPGRNVCPSEKWRLEYSGYLMAERHTHKKSEFICMDRELEAKEATHGNQDGALFYMVEGRCLIGGGLPCGPYVNGYELTCAVCTI